MAHKVKCYYCGKIFDRDKEPWVKVSERRYAHKNCAISKEEIMSQEQKDKEALYSYIMELFGTEYVEPRIQKQISSYIEQYNYSYSGIQKSLKYFYEIKGNPIEKANGGIGIVPYVYKRAFDYYYSLWQAQQKNVTKVVTDYVPVIKEIIIANPQRKVKKRKLFSFLDEEDK